MRLVQFMTLEGETSVAVVDGDKLQMISEFSSTYDLARHALSEGESLETLIENHLTGERANYLEIIRSGRLLSPIHHPDPAHFWITGTGLTHSGSAATRDAMHKALQAEDLSDSMKIFKMGLEGGKPKGNEKGVQPEWFYKGNGSSVIRPDGDMDLPDYAMDGGEEPEIVAFYLIGADGNPYRIGYALGNEYSDHVMERINYLYLAHSKLRQCAFGPELLLGELPASVTGEVSIVRNGQTIWSKGFSSGADHMIHSLENLEYHHFKYELFRKPGDLHGHFFGTATLSFGDGVKTKEGDQFQIESDTFGMPLRNTLKRKKSAPWEVRQL